MIGFCGWRSSKSRLTHFRRFYKTETDLKPKPLVLRTATYFPQISYPAQRYYTIGSFKMSEAEKKWPAKLVREKFLNYFASKDHTIGM
jgi:hypothetical protein